MLSRRKSSGDSPETPCEVTPCGSPGGLQPISAEASLLQADDPPVSFWCAFRIFSLCLFDRSYQMLTEKATFSNTLGKCLMKVITLMLNTATGLWQSQQTETGLWRRTMFCLSFILQIKAKHCPALRHKSWKFIYKIYTIKLGSFLYSTYLFLPSFKHFLSEEGSQILWI